MKEIIQRSIEGEFSYQNDLWKNISPEGLDLAIKMADRDQYKRPSAKECFEHPWFSIKHSKRTLKGTLKNLKNFKTVYSLLKERAKEKNLVPQLRTSSPLFARKSSTDTCSKASFNDIQIDSLGCINIEEPFTPTSYSTLGRFRTSSAQRLCAPTLSSSEVNPFLSAITAYEESKSVKNTKITDDMDEIPSERPIKRHRAKSFNGYYDFENVEVRIFSYSPSFSKIKNRHAQIPGTPNVAKMIPLQEQNDFGKVASFTISFNSNLKDTKDSEATPRTDILIKKIKNHISNKIQ